MVRLSLNNLEELRFFKVMLHCKSFDEVISKFIEQNKDDKAKFLQVKYQEGIHNE